MAPLSWAELQKIIVPREVPTSEEYRWYAGANVTPQRIQEVLRQAECGYMAPLTDLEDEMLMLDAHGAAVAQKRMAALQSLPWSVTAAKGEGIDDGLAEEIADATRRMYEGIPAFDDAIYNQAWGTFHARACHEIHWDTYPRRPHFRPRELQWIKARRLSFGPARQLLIVEPWLAPSGFQSRGIDTTAWPCHFWTFTPKLFGEYPEKEGIGPRMLYWMLFKRLSWRWRLLLLEIFALPWRIVKARYDANGNPMASADQIKAAAEIVQRLGLDSTAWLGPGIDIEVVTVDAASSDLFQTTGADADLQLSKIALGNTATTEGNESNRSNSIIQLGSEELLNAKDASGMSGSINRDIGIPFTGLNYGWDKLDHAAVFKIKAEPARDTTKELEHADKLLSMGAPIALNQLYEVSGWRAPNEEPYVVRGGDGIARVVDPSAPAAPEPERNPDDAVAVAGDLEDSGTGQAAENAEADLEALERAKAHPQCNVARDWLREEGLDGQDIERAIELCLTGQIRRLDTVPMLTDAAARRLSMTIIPPFRIVPAPGEPARPFLGWT